jgi:hypothetical protein
MRLEMARFTGASADGKMEKPVNSCTCDVRQRAACLVGVLVVTHSFWETEHETV